MNPFLPDVVFHGSFLDPTRRFSAVYCPIVGIVLFILTAVLGYFIVKLLPSSPDGVSRVALIFSFAVWVYVVVPAAINLTRCSHIKISKSSIAISSLWRKTIILPIHAIQDICSPGYLVTINLKKDAESAPDTVMFYSKPGFNFFDSTSQIERFLDSLKDGENEPELNHRTKRST